MGNAKSSPGRGGGGGDVDGVGDTTPQLRSKSSRRSKRSSKDTQSCPDLERHVTSTAPLTASRSSEPEGQNGVKVYRSLADSGEVKRLVVHPAEPNVDIKVYRRSASNLSRTQSSVDDEPSMAPMTRSVTMPRGMALGKSAVIRANAAGTMPRNQLSASLDKLTLPEAVATKRKLLDFETSFTKHLSSLYSELSEFVQLSALSIALGPLPLTHPVSLWEYLSSDTIPIDLLPGAGSSEKYRLTIPVSMFHGVMHVRREGLTGREDRVSLAQELFVCLAVDAASELSSIYEYQIGLLGGSIEVDFLARHGADCAMAYLKSNNRFMDRNAVVRGVICGRSEAPPEHQKIISIFLGGKEIKWAMDDVFKLPGLIKCYTSNKGETRYRYFVSSKSDPMTYGYRGQMLERDYITGKCGPSDEDEAGFPDEVRAEFEGDDLHRSYKPRPRRVDANENVQMRAQHSWKGGSDDGVSNGSGAAEVIQGEPKYIIRADSTGLGSPRSPMANLTTVRSGGSTSSASGGSPNVRAFDSIPEENTQGTVNTDTSRFNFDKGDRNNPVMYQEGLKRSSSNYDNGTDVDGRKRMPDIVVHSTPKSEEEQRWKSLYNDNHRTSRSSDDINGMMNHPGKEQLYQANPSPIPSPTSTDDTLLRSSSGKVPPRVPVRRTPYNSRDSTRLGSEGIPEDPDEPPTIQERVVKKSYTSTEVTSYVSPSNSNRSSVISDRRSPTPRFTSDQAANAVELRRAPRSPPAVSLPPQATPRGSMATEPQPGDDFMKFSDFLNVIRASESADILENLREEQTRRSVASQSLERLNGGASSPVSSISSQPSSIMSGNRRYASPAPAGYSGGPSLQVSGDFPNLQNFARNISVNQGQDSASMNARNSYLSANNNSNVGPDRPVFTPRDGISPTQKVMFVPDPNRNSSISSRPERTSTSSVRRVHYSDSPDARLSNDVFEENAAVLNSRSHANRGVLISDL